MALQATSGDALRFEDGGIEIQHLVAIGTVSGVAVLAAAAVNGPGYGWLTMHPGAKLTWRAPGSQRDGLAVEVNADGVYLLEDGENRNAWLRVQTFAGYLSAGHDQCRVYLRDRFETAIGHDDLTAAECSAGDVATWTVTMHNVGAFRMTDLRVWLDGAVTSLEISDDGLTWVSPSSEAGALVFGTLAAGASATLYLRRTVGAGAPAAAKVLNVLHARYDGW